jgi:hypothetical protein
LLSGNLISGAKLARDFCSTKILSYRKKKGRKGRESRGLKGLTSVEH